MPMTLEQAKHNTELVRGLRRRVAFLEKALREAGNANGTPIATYMDSGAVISQFEARATLVHQIVANALRGLPERKKLSRRP